MLSRPVSWSTQVNKKTPQDYKKDRAEKYAQYFQGNWILPIPELVVVQPKTLSLIVTNIKTRRLAGLKKDKFEELLKATGIPARYFCRHSFATWDILLPSQELATKLLGNSSITTKYYRLQPEYMGRRRIKVTMCNVPIQLGGDVLALFLSDYGDVEDFITMKSFSGTAHGDYSFTKYLNRGGFQAIPHTLDYEDQAMMVVVEGRKPQCWHCKQIGHFSRSCPQKNANTTVTLTATTTATASSVSTSITTNTMPKTNIPNTQPTETGDHPSNKEVERWTQVTWGKKKSSSKAPKSSPAKTGENKNTEEGERKTTDYPKMVRKKGENSITKTEKRKKEKTNEINVPHEEMETSTNLKRRRDSADSITEGEGEKQLKNQKHAKKNNSTTKTTMTSTNYSCARDSHVLENDFNIFSSYGSRSIAGVSLLVGCSFDADVDFVFAVDRGRFVVADFAVKSFTFRLVVVYAPNIAVERVSFIRRLVLFLDDSKRLVLMGDWNAIFGPKIDKVGRGASRSGRCESSLVDLMTHHVLVDRFHLDHTGREMWTRLDSSPSAKVGSYLDRVLVRRADSDFISCSMFHLIAWTDHKLVRVSLCLANRPSLAGYWKFSTSLLEIRDFWDQLESLIKWALVGAVTWNRWWVSLKHRIRDFATKYGQQLNLDGTKETKSIDDRLSWELLNHRAS